MKKSVFIVIVIGILIGNMSWAEEKAQVRLCGNIILPADSGYKDVYGKSAFYPELKAGYALSGPLYLWAGYGLLSKKGETPVLKYEAKSTQHFISGGLGTGGVLSDRLEWLAEAGLLVVAYKEEAMGVSVSDTAFGLLAGAGVSYRLSQTLFITTEAGYIYASDKVEGETVKPGGFKALVEKLRKTPK